MIKIENLSRSYGDFLAVNQVSFEIRKGEIVGLLGHNGAGKTTILKMLTGYLEPSSGSIEIDGRPIEGRLQEIQETIGYLPENCPVYPEMTVVDYLDYMASLHGINEAERPGLVVAAMAKTDITDRANQTIATLSRGYRQRIGVAQAILHEPAILVLDEPTNGLDPTQIRHMRELITNLAEHSTIIISTHILQEVQAICDRAIIIKNGTKAVDSRLDELQSESRLILQTDAPPDRARPVLEGFTGIGEVLEQAAGAREPGYCYAMALAGGSDRYQVTAELAGKVQDEGWKIYGFYPETRDLETVFAEISA